MKKPTKQDAKVVNFGTSYGASPLADVYKTQKLFEGISKAFAVPQEYLYGFSKPDFGIPDDAFFKTMQSTIDKLNEKYGKGLGKQSFLEAKAKKVELVQYAAAGSEGATLGVRTPYSADFVHTLKMEIPAKDRQWDPGAKEWVVSEKHLDSLIIMIKDHYGVEPKLVQEIGAKAITKQAPDETLALHVSSDWIELQTPYDANFLSDFKDYFDSKKWLASVKRWKVPYTKENLNMAAYLIKRHYNKTPEIKKA